MRLILDDLNYDYQDLDVSKDKWSEKEKESIAEAKIIAEKKDYKIFYLRANRDSVDVCKGIASKICDNEHGLCLVCSSSGTARTWLFSAQAKKHQMVFADTRHVPVEITHGIGVKKDFINFLENIRISSKSDRMLTTAEIMNMLTNALEKFEIPANVIAIEKMEKIYAQLITLDYESDDIEKILTRLLYCLFAEDTEIFNRVEDNRGLFEDWLVKNSNSDGCDLGSKLVQLFDILNTPHSKRGENYPKTMLDFPYVNGGLFEDNIKMPKTNKEIRAALINAAQFNWSDISPSILGSLLQNIMDKKEQRSSGAHYTTEENILKVIRPLFLDGLYEEFSSIIKKDLKSKKKQLEKLQKKLSNLTFFDPACGAGNFLIITYKELRRLELSIIMELHDRKTKLIDVQYLSKIDVNQFYGIEIKSFSAKISETVLWMMDHLMNRELADYYGQAYARIPLEEQPNIMQADALEFDWNKLLPATECDYVFGNPPFNGTRAMNDYQKAQTLRVTKSSSLDYVSNWFVKAVEYTHTHTHTHTHTEETPPSHNIEIAFVSTNSITQGEQVKLLFPQIFDKGFEISFAYSSFKWNSEAKSKAQVTVVIIGLSKNMGLEKRLFDYVDENFVKTNPKEITAYLRGSNVQQTIVNESNKPLNGLPNAHVGSDPKDDWNYVFNESEYLEFLKLEPEAKKWIFPYSSGGDFLHNKKRHVLSLRDITPHELNKLSKTMQRVEKVREFRLSTKSKMTQKRAETPLLFVSTRIPTKPFLAIPRVSSETRKYIPMDFMKPPTITSIQLYHIEDASIELFGLLESHMHMVWVRSIGGKLETRLRYSAKLVYNTFPIPKDYSSLKPYAQEILDIRKKYPESTLAELYGLTTMPPDLLKAHQTLDKKVEKLYRDKPFESDKERLEFLFEEYKKMALK